MGHCTRTTNRYGVHRHSVICDYCMISEHVAEIGEDARTGAEAAGWTRKNVRGMDAWRCPECQE